GGTGVTYTPDIPGTYYAQMSFPEQQVEVATLGLPAGTILEASTTDKLEIKVQTEPLEYWPGVPLPSEYWSRPINAQFREWSSIAGNWLMAKGYFIDMDAPGNDNAPEAPHILWAKPLVKGGLGALGGGLAGGTSGDHAFEDGDAYEGLFGQPVIIGGVLYFNRYKASGDTAVEQEVVAVDLRTGNEVWVRNWNNTRLAFGQTFYWDSFNYHAVFAILWTTIGTTWHAYEASTGRWIYSITGVQTGTGTNIYGPNGEILRYTVNLAAGWMLKWNTTRVVTERRIQQYGPVETNQAHGSYLREYMGTTFNGTLGIEWNVTIPKGLPGSVVATLDDRILGANFATGSLAPSALVVWALSTKTETRGQLLFNISWSPPRPDARYRLEAASVKDGIFVIVCAETTEKWGFDINTGRQLWGPTAKQDYKDAWQYASGGVWEFIYNGKLYSAGTGGTVYVYDVKTGNRLWTYDFVDRYHEFLFGNNWFIYAAFIADGKFYFNYAEHSPGDPKERGSQMVCLDAETGEEIWRLNYYGTVWGGKPVIGDSIIACLNSYDSRIYAIGKGPSATTLAASPEISMHGGKVLLKGMVTDISPGTDDIAIQKRFPGGVPVVADECMSAWMEYVYMQFPRPADVKGVEVVISVLDPNGNCYEVARATTDASGFFSAVFEPPVPGKYTVIAEFKGSKAYWGSYAETAIYVEDAPPATPPPTPPPQAPVETYFVVSTAAIIIAIAIIGALMIRKH
ncbi:MAG: PQQ-binding-like beta-propeller repeat protein, partial [Candidatus Bathyarchaeia archaeon]